MSRIITILFLLILILTGCGKEELETKRIKDVPIYTSDAEASLVKKEYKEPWTEYQSNYIGDGSFTSNHVMHKEVNMVTVYVEDINKVFEINSKSIYEKYDIGDTLTVSLYERSDGKPLCREYIKGY